MNPRLLPTLLALAPLWTAHAKPPPAKPAARPAPTPPAAVEQGPASLLRWLLLQDGGASAAAVSWPELVRAAGGKQVVPLDPANPADAATLAQLGAALDALLPRLNRPDGTLRATPALTTAEATARVADELRAALATLPGHTVEPLTAPGAPCLALRWTDTASGRTCCLLVALYPTGGKDTAARALTVRAADLAGQFTADGACLLVGFEHNGKAGRELALLNWEAVDLARVSLRCAVTFEADADALHAPGATLADGRRGRD